MLQLSDEILKNPGRNANKNSKVERNNEESKYKNRDGIARKWRFVELWELGSWELNQALPKIIKFLVKDQKFDASNWSKKKPRNANRFPSQPRANLPYNAVQIPLRDLI